MSSDSNDPPVNPYDPPTGPPDMANQPRRQVPKQVNTSTPRVIGILNIVFGSLILLCGLCQAAQNLVLRPMMEPMMEMQRETLQKQIEEERQDQVDSLLAEEEAAETKEEKELIASQREALEEQEVVVPDMSAMMGMPDVPFLTTYIIADLVTNLILNSMLICAGIWLYQLKSKGRRLSLWVSSIKILRLIAFNAFFLIMLVPEMSKKMGEVFDQMAQQAGGGGAPPGIPNMSAFYGIMFSVSAVCMILFGSIYPALVLWLMNTRNAKDVCQN